MASDCFAETIRMATTTSTENSGLLDVILPVFEKKHDVKMHAIATGTGKALKLAENGDVDLVLVHAPDMEAEFIEKGFGVDRTEVFYNNFVVVGPKDDPACVASAKDAYTVFKKIAQAQHVFVSRADNSGTYAKECNIWDRACNFPSTTLKGRWYIETGQGMAATLKIADEKQGYCLVDSATFISYEDKLDLVVLFEKDAFLKNTYSVIAVNPKLHPHVKYRQVALFIGWIVSDETRMLIEGFGKKGKALFRLQEEESGVHL